MDGILVSINCITYNHEKYISEAIDSFLMQRTNFNFEVLIHDDASTDRTSDIVREYQKKYPDIIKPIIQKENQYSQGKRLLGYRYNFSRAMGKYIAVCEGDDYWTDPFKLQKQVDYMENHHDCSMCFHAAELVNVGRRRIGAVKPYNHDCVSSTEDIISGGGGFIATASILYRKNVMDNPPDFFINAPVGDYALQILTSTQDYAYYIDEFMSAYRIGVEGSWTTNNLLHKNNEEIVKRCNGQVYMLNSFNIYSNGKYSEAVEKKILRYEFQLERIENNIKGIKSIKYKTIYNSLGIIQKIEIYLQCYLPRIYRKLSYIKRYIKKILISNIKLGA
ncbi:MAG: glycosyltransferase family 2 protein [Clostridiaceae bacterium]